jgi:hypothetical protein
MFILRIIIIVTVLLNRPCMGDEKKQTIVQKSDHSSLAEYAISVCKKSTGLHHNSKTLIFFIDFARFGCVNCLNEFLDFCDTIRMRSEQVHYVTIILFFERDLQNENVQYKQMKSWVHATGINFPFYLVPSKVFRDNFILDTSLMILDSNFSFEYFDRFPLTSEKKKIILNKLFPKER